MFPSKFRRRRRSSRKIRRRRGTVGDAGTGAKETVLCVCVLSGAEEPTVREVRREKWVDEEEYRTTRAKRQKRGIRRGKRRTCSRGFVYMVVSC